MKNIFLFNAILLFALAFQSCQTADKKSATTKDSVSGDTTMVNGMHETGSESTESKLDAQGSDFLKTAATGGLMEIEAAKIAQANSKNTQVKGFATLMLADHTKANMELKALAIKKKIIVPDSLPEMERSHLNEMKKMSGADFDKHYMNMMLTDHDKTVKLFTQGSENRDVELKNFALNTLKVIKEHDSLAKQIVAKQK
ncbi:DUF4142 domain-containing protein [Pedobacter sp. AW1-32]|uniref:DUF4142 domain-containing protein n=1 Tax=Pedobacter sp. AW1-32 TaxID=3383026 RepID=UPI003FEF0018